MNNAVNGLQALLTGILDISRLEAGVLVPEPAIIDLDRLLRRLCSEYEQSAARRGLEIRIASRNASTLADPNMLERALRNLIENALRYTTKGGIILGLRRRGRRLRIDVIDTGVGIPSEKQDEIFQEFRQLNNPARDLSHGLGLGLAIVARLTKLLGADLEVASRVGRGSRFSLSLPETAASRATEIDIRPIQDVPAAKVLIVEDNENLRFGLITALEDWGYLTLDAANGECALDLLTDAGDAVDLVICDYRLGPGKNGVETIGAIQARLGRLVPALLLTGDIPQERLSQFSCYGLEVLHKPVMLEELRRKVATTICRTKSAGLSSS
jgi:CheY-like chemotaxis protein/anti-sigma regulatory factor (Ser/Thr protein kinase)